MHDDPLTIAGETFSSRLILGTAGYPTQRIMADAVAASGCEMVTVSMRRISLDGHGSDTVELLKGRRFLPNTAGCETARDAILTAELGREALDTNWVKLEIIGDRETLYPDAAELLEGHRGPGRTRFRRPALTASRIRCSASASPTGGPRP